MEKTKFPFLLWVSAGILGVIIRDIYSLIIQLTGITKYFIWNVGADLFIQSSQVHTISGHFLGILTDLVIGAMLGVVTGLVLWFLAPKNYIVMGLGIGLSAWVLFFGILLHNLPHSSTVAPQDPISNISSFVEHAISGIVTAWVINKYAFQKVDEKESKNPPKAQRLLSFRLVPEPVKKPLPVIQRHPKDRFKQPARLIKLSRNFPPK